MVEGGGEGLNVPLLNARSRSDCLEKGTNSGRRCLRGQLGEAAGQLIICGMWRGYEIGPDWDAEPEEG